MPKLTDLGLTNEQVGSADFANIPEQRSGMKPPLYPGAYRFKFPNITSTTDCWDTMETEKGPRLNVIFEGSSGLFIVQSPGKTHDGEQFDTRIGANERNRARRGEPEILACDWDYILRDVFDVQRRPTTSPQYAQAIMQHVSGKEMTADVEWSWSCNPKRNIYVDKGDGTQQEVEGQHGCGNRWYMGGNNGIQKARSNPADPNSPLVWPERVTCPGKDDVPCGASVRAFANLRNFRK
jgi:hypothetical protein